MEGREGGSLHADSKVRDDYETLHTGNRKVQVTRTP